jgi:hypothetical protein
MSTFINIEPNQIKVSPYQAFANITINSQIDSGSVLIYQADFDNLKFSISDINDPLNVNLESTQNTYKQLVHHSLNHLFYKDYEFKQLEKFGKFNLNQKRELNKHATLLCVSQNKYLEGIKNNTLTLNITDTISGSILSIKDDGNGNLIDTDKETLCGTLFDTLQDFIVGEYNFNDCFYYNDSVINAIYPNFYVNKGEYIYNRNLNDDSKYHNNGYRYNISFNENERGFYGIFNGNSYIKINHNSQLNFKREDEFAISFFIKTLDSNKYFLVKNGYNTVQQLQRTNNDRYNYSNVANVDIETNYSYYPFQIGINSSGKLFIEQSDGTNNIISISTTSINDNNWYHVIVQRTETTLDVIINGVKEDSESTSDLTSEIYNNSNIYIGKYINNYFSGSLDEIRFYNRSLTASEYLKLSTLEINNNYKYYVGNVFYESGFIILTSTYYKDLTSSLDFILKFKSTKTIYEHEYICKLEASDLNHTMNESITKNGVDILAPYTGSYFQPYITTIGLYNEDAQLLAVAKTSQPIPKLENTNMTFIVRFDI